MTKKSAGNIPDTCRRFGISPAKFRKWRKRFQGLGAAGRCDQSRAPHHSLKETPKAPGVEESLPAPELPLRRRQDSRLFHAVSQHSRRSVDRGRILAKHGLLKVPANQNHQPHGKTLEALRESQARPSLADGREFPNASLARRSTSTSSPPSTTARAAARSSLATPATRRRHRARGRGLSPAAVPRPARPDRQPRRVPVKSHWQPRGLDVRQARTS